MFLLFHHASIGKVKGVEICRWPHSHGGPFLLAFFSYNLCIFGPLYSFSITRLSLSTMRIVNINKEFRQPPTNESAFLSLLDKLKKSKRNYQREPFLSAIKEETYTIKVCLMLCMAILFLYTLPSFVRMRFLSSIRFVQHSYRGVLGFIGFYLLIHFDFSVLRYDASDPHGWKVGWGKNFFFSEREREREREVAVACRLERARPMSVQQLYLRRSCRLSKVLCSMSERIRYPLGIRCIGV